MNKEIYEFVGDKLNECFFEFCPVSGDIAPDDSLELEKIQLELTDLIEKVANYNK